MILYPIAAIVGALLYRVRGGFDPFHVIPGTQTARAVWCVPVGLAVGTAAAGMHGGDPYAGYALGVLAGIGAFVGLLTGNTVAEDWTEKPSPLIGGLAATGIGIMRLTAILAPTIALSSHVELWLTLLAGVLHSTAYALGPLLPVPQSWRGRDIRPVDGATAWAEAIWGAGQGAVIAYVLVNL